MGKIQIRAFVGALALIFVLAASAVSQAQTYTFRQVAEQQYDMFINGRTFKRLDFRSNPLSRFEISERTLGTFGVTGDILLGANDDLQNNVFLGTNLRVSLSEDFVRGSLRNIPRVPRAEFDFVQVRRNKFRLFINGHKTLWVDLSQDSSKTLFISKVSLSRFGVTPEDAMAILDRNFGNNQAMTSDGFNIFLTRDRALSSGDTLFYFDQVDETGFRLFLNGRKAIWLELNDFDGDVIFQLSKTSLASRFGLTGVVDDILQDLQQNGVDITDLGNGRFQFTVDRNLFLNGGQRNVEDTIFLVRRNEASVS